MRTFLSPSNLCKAAALALGLTLTAVPRLWQAGVPLALFIPATFLTLTLVCGTATAWGSDAGMPGLVTPRITLWRGVAVAAMASLVLLPFRLILVDPILRAALLNSGDPSRMALAFPGTPGGQLSLLLWSAGFQVMCLVVAPVSLVSRLSGNRWVGVIACVTFRLYVMSRQVAEGGIVDAVPYFFILAALGTGLQAGLFATCGLVPAMLMAAGLDLHLFVGAP